MAKKKDKDVLVTLTTEYQNKIAEEKLRKLILNNDHLAFDLNKKKETICYRNVAMSEFEKAVGFIYAQIKNADEQLTALLRLNTTQSEMLHEYMDNILVALSNIDIELSTTDDYDAEHYFSGKARRNNDLKTGE